MLLILDSKPKQRKTKTKKERVHHSLKNNCKNKTDSPFFRRLLNENSHKDGDICFEMSLARRAHALALQFGRASWERQRLALEFPKTCFLQRVGGKRNRCWRWQTHSHQLFSSTHCLDFVAVLREKCPAVKICKTFRAYARVTFRKKFSSFILELEETRPAFSNKRRQEVTYQVVPL